MLNMNQSYQRLSASINIHNKFIAVFDHLWRSLCHFLSYSTGYVPYKGPSKNMHLPKKVCAFRRPFIILYKSLKTALVFYTNICLHSSLCLKRKCEKWGRTTRFCFLTPLFDSLSSRKPEKLNLCCNYNKQKNLRSLPRACLRQFKLYNVLLCNSCPHFVIPTPRCNKVAPLCITCLSLK